MSTSDRRLWTDAASGVDAPHLVRFALPAGYDWSTSEGEDGQFVAALDGSFATSISVEVA